MIRSFIKRPAYGTLAIVTMSASVICAQAGYAQQAKSETYTVCSLGKRFSNGFNNFSVTTCVPKKTPNCENWVVDNWSVEPGHDHADSLVGNCVVSTGTLSDSSWFGNTPSCRTFTQNISSHCTNQRVSQSSMKMVCGVPGSAPVPQPNFVPGQYNTVINIHNPTYQKQKMRWKIVSAGNGRDGKKVVGFVYGEIGPDASQYVDCEALNGATNGVFDGFFVIESTNPLDVSAVYTLSETNGTPVSIDVDSTKDRSTLIGESWTCEQDPECKNRL